MTRKAMAATTLAFRDRVGTRSMRRSSHRIGVDPPAPPQDARGGGLDYLVGATVAPFFPFICPCISLKPGILFMSGFSVPGSILSRPLAPPPQPGREPRRPAPAKQETTKRLRNDLFVMANLSVEREAASAVPTRRKGLDTSG